MENEEQQHPDNLQPFTRPRTPHKTVEAIDDFAHAEEQSIEYTSETDFVAPSLKPRNRGWLKSKQAMPQLEKDLKYGQYLHIPKAQKSIFTSRAQRQRQRNLLWATIALCVLIVCLIALFKFL